MTSVAAASVPVTVRLSAAFLGNPSFRRAFGGFKGTPSGLRGPQEKGTAPAREATYRLDKPGKPGNLPRIWLTEPGPEGREYCAVYPSGPDRGGLRAEELGERCFAEGLSAAAVADGALRIQCFQAAEICFLHAAARGNTRAKVRLAVIYRDDMCAGASWFQAQHPRRTLAARASALLREAADEGSAEACWLLADAQGVSRYWALRALKLAGPDGWQQGSAWLRFARAAEAQAQDLAGIALAHESYDRAARALSASAEEGNWHAKRFAAEAEAGRRRMEQELFWTAAPMGIS